MEIKAEGGKSASDILREKIIPEQAKKMQLGVYQKLPFAADGFKSTKTPDVPFNLEKANLQVAETKVVEKPKEVKATVKKEKKK